MQVQRVRRGYTLIEVLILVVILGIAASLVIPSLGSAEVMRTQAAVRQIVADLTLAQSEALAYQRGRALVFDVTGNSYRVVEIRGGVIDPTNNTLYEVALDDGSTFGDSRIVSAEFDGDATMMFDEMGAPAVAPGNPTPPATGVIRIEGGGNAFEIEIDGYTGRVVVRDRGAV